ncbi:MAG: hypothetical protein AB7F70_07110 [Candidatus Omnitrophota bacterium]
MFGSLFLSLFLLLVMCTHVFAAINLRVSPVDGGNSLRFGRVDLPSTTNKEVRIRVTSSEETQYQVFQRILEPFHNERGETLDFDAIVVSSLSGSNSSGTIELQNVEQLSYAEQLVYTSSNNGISDSFVLVYQANPDKINTAGDFSGQIIYTVRPIGGGGSQEEVILNAFLEISSELTVQTETSTGADLIRLHSTGQTTKEDYFKLKFEGNRGKKLSVYQEVVEFPANEINQTLDTDTLELSSVGGDNGQLYLTESLPLSRQRTLVYSSEAADDEIWVNYRLNERKKAPQGAGRFTGRVSYTVESDVYTQTFPVDLEVEIEPVFELFAEYPAGGMSFKGLLPNSEPQYKEVVVTVNSNTGKPYWVSQNITATLMNEKGEKIDDDYFTVKQEIMGDGTGKVENADFSSLTEGETALYYSDRYGSPVKFKVVYRLRPYKGMQAGDYKTAVVYSLGEI